MIINQMQIHLIINLIIKKIYHLKNKKLKILIKLIIIKSVK